MPLQTLGRRRGHAVTVESGMKSSVTTRPLGLTKSLNGA